MVAACFNNEMTLQACRLALCGFEHRSCAGRAESGPRCRAAPLPCPPRDGRRCMMASSHLRSPAQPVRSLTSMLKEMPVGMHSEISEY